MEPRNLCTTNDMVAMQSNAEDRVGFVEKSKRFFINLQENLIVFITFVKDQCIHYFRGDQIERIRVYHVWPGNNVFFFRGRIICGPDPRGLILTLVAITLSAWIFSVHVANDSTFIMCTFILTTIVLVNLGMVSMIDPGIIPRNDKPSPSELEARTKRVIINGVEIKLKYCRICNIIRPPRCCHCAVCDNCVENFDHHCPWLSQCIGKRNYRLYIVLIFTALVLFVYIFVFSCKSLRNKVSKGGGNTGLVGLLRDCPETLMLAILTFVASCFLGCLACYHLYLLVANQTAYENYRQQYVNSQNPHDQGVLNNIKEVMLSPWSPSRVDFRAEACIQGSTR